MLSKPVLQRKCGVLASQQLCFGSWLSLDTMLCLHAVPTCSLHVAARRGQVGVVLQLLAGGANLDATGNCGSTPLPRT
jgi:hypothetical protein